MLVIDQDAQTLTDRRLVAHLAADEPAVNARVVAELYLADRRRRSARALDDRDWTTLPGGREPPDEPEPPAPGELRDARGAATAWPWSTTTATAARRAGCVAPGAGARSR